MEIKWIWVSKEFIHRYWNNFKCYITSPSSKQGDGNVCEEIWVRQLCSPSCAAHNPKVNSHDNSWKPLQCSLLPSLWLSLRVLSWVFLYSLIYSWNFSEAISTPEAMPSVCLQEHLSEYLLCVLPKVSSQVGPQEYLAMSDPESFLHFSPKSLTCFPENLSSMYLPKTLSP